METTKLKIKSLIHLTLDKLQDDLNVNILREQLNLLYLNKFYDEDAAEFLKLFNSTLENIIHIIDGYRSDMIISLEKSLGELESKIKTKKSLTV